jgi:two-component system NtrC family sensor kinase
MKVGYLGNRPNHQRRNDEKLLGLSIQTKIMLGYLLSLGIVVGGVIAGTHISSIKQDAAELLLEDAKEELELPVLIQEQLVLAESHQRLLPSLLGNSEEWQEHVQDYELAITTAEQAWQELRASYTNPEVKETNAELEIAEGLIEDYDNFIGNYHHQISKLIKTIDPATVSASEREIIQLELLAQNTPDQVQILDAFDADLHRLIAATENDRIEAEAALARANQLKDQITLGSLVAAVMAAIILSLLISHAITTPLKKTADVAQRVIDEGDFDLQAPIHSEDEVGQLTQTLNLLIQQVKKLLQEQESAKALLVHNEKMVSLGQLVAGIAHEINNPVNFIHGNLKHVLGYADDLLNLIQLYQTEYPQPSDTIQHEIEAIELDFVQEDLEKTLLSMRTGTDRIREIVLSLRNFSRLDEAALKEVDLHEGLDSTLMILQHRFKAKSGHPNIEVIQEYDPEFPKIECYASQINQVFMNLLANAVDAFESQSENASPRITIRTGRQDKEQVFVQISDNGPGIPEAAKARIFNPFFTTKPIGKGTGIGLSISHQIVVETHGGQLRCESNLNKGTVFTIVLPIKPSCSLKLSK